MYNLELIWLERGRHDRLVSSH